MIAQHVEQMKTPPGLRRPDGVEALLRNEKGCSRAWEYRPPHGEMQSTRRLHRQGHVSLPERADGKADAIT